MTVNLYDSNGVLIRTAVTDGGQYRFDDLIPDEYQVEFLAPNGFTFSPQEMGSEAIDSDGPLATVAVLSGDEDFTIDAGLY